MFVLEDIEGVVFGVRRIKEVYVIHDNVPHHWGLCIEVALHETVAFCKTHQGECIRGVRQGGLVAVPSL